MVGELPTPVAQSWVGPPTVRDAASWGSHDRVRHPKGKRKNAWAPGKVPTGPERSRSGPLTTLGVSGALVDMGEGGRGRVTAVLRPIRSFFLMNQPPPNDQQVAARSLACRVSLEPRATLRVSWPLDPGRWNLESQLD